MTKDIFARNKGRGEVVLWLQRRAKKINFICQQQREKNSIREIRGQLVCRMFCALKFGGDIIMGRRVISFTRNNVSTPNKLRKKVSLILLELKGETSFSLWITDVMHIKQHWLNIFQRQLHFTKGENSWKLMLCIRWSHFLPFSAAGGGKSQLFRTASEIKSIVNTFRV